MEKMTDSRAVEVLAAHNEWRRGGDGPQTDPTTLGLALDHAIARLREPAEAQGGWELPSPLSGDFDCPKAAAARSCPCGFCRALRTPSAPVGVEE